MRNNLTALLMTCLPFIAFAQSSKTISSYSIPTFKIDSETQMVTYTDVVQIDGVAKDSLYNLAQQWVKKYFKSSTTVMQIQDKEEGIMEGRHSFYVMRDIDGVQTKGDLIKYTFNLRFREGRYKYTVTKINVQKASYYGIENWLNDDEKSSDIEIESYLNQIDEYLQKFIAAMIEGIKPDPLKKEEEW